MAAPVISITQITKTRISQKSGQNVSTVRFTSNQDLVAWEARSDGAGVGSGGLVGNAAGAITVTSKPPAIFGASRLSGRYQYARPLAGDEVQGIILPAGDLGSFEVEASELQSGDKSYRITLYGKNAQGEWSKYG